MKADKQKKLGAPPKPAAERRTVAVRFLVTEAEFAVIQEAAALDVESLERQLTERGLPEPLIQAMKRPSDWSRYVVMKAAKQSITEGRERRIREARLESAAKGLKTI